MIRLIVFAVFISAGMGLAYLLFVRSGPREPEPLVFDLENDFTLGDVHLRQHRNSVLEWELTAVAATYDQPAKQALLSTVRFRIFQTGGDKPVPINVRGSAGRALVDDAHRRIVLLDGVAVYKDFDVEFHSPRLDYRIDEGILNATGPVTVKNKDATMEGESLEYDLRTQRAEIKAPMLSQ